MSRLAIGLASACAACALLAVGPALGQDAEQKKRAVDSRIDSLEDKIEKARAREGVLSSQIAEVTAEIRALEDDVGAAEARLDQLEGILALHQRKLDNLNELFFTQTSRLVYLQRQHKAATDRLNKRVVEIYTSESPDALAVVLQAASFEEILDQLEFLNEIGRQDEKIAAEVARAKVAMRKTREATRKTRNRVRVTTQQVAARTAEQRAVRDRLAWNQRQLATARRDKQDALAATKATREEYLHEVEALLAQSAALAAKIQAAQAAATYAAPTGSRSPSASGFVWPVHGILTSSFGWRWGRMHEGIDIAVPSGSAVVASAAGTVIVAGWMGGYGNLVVVDHGNGIATAYGHNTSIAVGVGQAVGQGQVIAYSGNTGNSTGPHVHFEVRVNGGAVDPLGYL
jgi:murein DD-endopeptidase MepM/ murein hydrolase activator NlpD